MAIGFVTENKNNSIDNVSTDTPKLNNVKEPVLSVVDVKFDDGRVLPYFNDQFDLSVNDLVYVDGKLSGKLGRVINVSTNFKISLEYYKKVIAQIDTTIHGDFYKFGGTVFTFDFDAIPFEQAKSWFVAPSENEEEFISSGGYSFKLSEIYDNDIISENAMNKGLSCLKEHKLLYIDVNSENLMQY